MPELDIQIGGRSFQVACQEGEELFLRTAAGLLDAEATPLMAQAGRMPEARMLLMSGLMLADRLAGVEEQLRIAETRLREIEARPRPAPERVEVRVEVPVERVVEVPVEIAVLPPGLADRLARMAAEAEALADALDAQTAGAV
ncbi:MAG: cell division protein ZapA [Gemmobacter sp.]|jgi:cell division protein ZapA|nr:cell division protein ZapA [Gemmobacter sp.]